MSCCRVLTRPDRRGKQQTSSLPTTARIYPVFPSACQHLSVSVVVPRSASGSSSLAMSVKRGYGATPVLPAARGNPENSASFVGAVSSAGNSVQTQNRFFPEVSRSHTSSWRSGKPRWIPGTRRAPRRLRLGLSGSDTGGGNNHYLNIKASKQAGFLRFSSLWSNRRLISRLLAEI